LSGTGVRIYQSSVNREQCDEIAALMDRMGPHKRYDRTRAYKGREYVESCWFFSGDLANRVRDDLPGKRPTYQLLWRMTQDEREAFLDAAMKGDGSGWGAKSQQFHQKCEDDLVWFQTLLHLSGRAGKVGMRRNREGGVVYLRNTNTTELQSRHQKGREYEHYQGEVWCVKVPSGAFVARRNGKVFITGNSGFPKSMNVSKAIDQAVAKEKSKYTLSPQEAAFCEWMRDHSGLTPQQVERLVGSRRFITGQVEIVNTATADNPRMGRRAMVPTA